MDETKGKMSFSMETRYYYYICIVVANELFVYIVTIVVILLRVVLIKEKTILRLSEIQNVSPQWGRKVRINCMNFLHFVKKSRTDT